MNLLFHIESKQNAGAREPRLSEDEFRGEKVQNRQRKTRNRGGREK